MPRTSQKYYDERRPTLGLRVDADVKDTLREIQKNSNGKTLSDVAEGILNNGLTNHLNSNSPNKNDVGDNIDAIKEYDDLIKNKTEGAYNDGFDDASAQVNDEVERLTKDEFLNIHPNSVLAEELTQEVAKEEDLDFCNECGYDKVRKGDKHCGGCGVEFERDNDNEEQEEGWLSGLLKWNNGE